MPRKSDTVTPIQTGVQEDVLRIRAFLRAASVAAAGVVCVAGTGSAPVLAADYTRYHSYEEMTAALRDFAKTHATSKDRLAGLADSLVVGDELFHQHKINQIAEPFVALTRSWRQVMPCSFCAMWSRSGRHGRSTGPAMPKSSVSGIAGNHSISDSPGSARAISTAIVVHAPPR
jgi:hypothetical protein